MFLMHLHLFFHLSLTVGISTDDPTLANFLSEYKNYCEKHLKPVERILSESPTLCPCIPNSLKGKINLKLKEYEEIGEVEREYHDLGHSGSWYPLSCIPRHKVAIIIPFRSRENHLKIILKVLIPILRKQLLFYTIFVIEQSSPLIFNKASLMNTGFKEASMFENYDCYIFHDVDMLPLNDRIFYTCSHLPLHLAPYVDKWDYVLPYASLFGGVTAFKYSHFVIVNGFSNSFYGWGGEDDDMYKRIIYKKLNITRYPIAVSRYFMIKHSSDGGNPSNIKSHQAFNYRPKSYINDGLNTLQYKVEKMEIRPLYVWFFISLPPQPHYILKKVQKSN